jgi:[phosphatase 2A protein]-leucine-carboxy methyltransferase
MTTPQIPHLSNFRRRGGQGRARGRAALSGDELKDQPSDEEKKTSQDRIVQSTDNDASVSRLSAVEAGYLTDPYAGALTTGEAARRYPIINRGICNSDPSFGAYLYNHADRELLRNLCPHDCH